MSAPATAPVQSAPPHPLVEIWRDFSRNRGAMIGLVALGLAEKFTHGALF